VLQVAQLILGQQGLRLRVGTGGEEPQDVLDLLTTVVLARPQEEGLGSPEPLRRRFPRHVGRVEDEMEPPQRVRVALVLGETVGDEQRSMEEQLPVVLRVRAVEKIDVLDRVRLDNDLVGHRLGLVGLAEVDRIGWIHARRAGRELLRVQLDAALEQALHAVAVELSDERGDVRVIEGLEAVALLDLGDDLGSGRAGLDLGQDIGGRLLHV
jgi:hypothetical protein